MMNSWLLLLPLCAALLYVMAVLSLKRAAELGVGLWESTFVSNLLAALAFQVVLVFGGNWLPLSFWWQPVVVALLFLLGQSATLFSLQRGDVSIATPVLGVKILLVASFTTIFIAQTISWQLWAAAALATLGIAALNHPGAHKVGANAKTTIVSAGFAAASFALFDVLVQKWSPAWGVGRFMPLTMACLGILSFALRPFSSRPLKELGPSAWRWLGMGGGLFALQTVVFVSAIAHFGNATAMNVVYSSRGLWSILAVVLLGHWFHSSEKQLGGDVMRWRFAGAALMFAAIVLVLI
jgi:drug/metabolite transporter (DMT)-like permease